MAFRGGKRCTGAAGRTARGCRQGLATQLRCLPWKNLTDLQGEHGSQSRGWVFSLSVVGSVFAGDGWGRALW